MNRIKRFILSLFRNIGLFFVMIYGFIYELFFKNNKSKKESIKKEEKVIVKTEDKTNKEIKESDYSSFEEPQSRFITDQVFIKLDSDIKKVILGEYCNIFNIKENRIEKKDKDVIKKIEKNIILDAKYNISHKRIENNQELKIFVNSNVIKEVDKLYNVSIKKIDLNKRRDYLFNILNKEKKNDVKILDNSKNIIIEPKKEKVVKQTDNVNKENFIIELDNNTINFMKDINSNRNSIVHNEEKKEKMIYPNHKIIIPSIVATNIIEDNNENMLGENIIEDGKDEDNLLEDTLNTCDMPVTLDDVINEKSTIELEEKGALLLKEIDEKVVEKIKEEKKLNIEEKKKEDEKKKEKKLEKINFGMITEKIKVLLVRKNIEVNKEELEDKEYEMLERRIDKLLLEIEKMKKKNISSEDLKKLDSKKEELLHMKDNINDARNIDIQNEENALNETIIKEDLDVIEEELEQVKLEHLRDLKLEGIKQVENLNNKPIKEATEIEKRLIYKKIKKANRSVKINNLISSIFLKNKYLLYLTSGLVVAKNLSFVDSILKRKSTDVVIDISNIKKGHDALEKALYLSKDNMQNLESLERQIYLKHPELQNDNTFKLQINGLKNNLIKREERLNKKKKMIDKYNINLNVKKLSRKIPN